MLPQQQTLQFPVYDCDCCCCCYCCNVEEQVVAQTRPGPPASHLCSHLLPSSVSVRLRLLRLLPMTASS